MIKLTIGMPTYFDYKGMMLTVRSLIENDLTDEIEILVVDNTPDKSYAATQKNQIDIINKDNVNYVYFPDQKGPAETKNKVFENAKGEYVLCIDSHVILEKGVVSKILDFVSNLKEEDQHNLYGGPLKNSSGNYSTHFENVWRNQMQGVWATDKEFLKKDEPKEFWACGCGFFFAKKENWLGFNPNFSGFGGEEGYIHEKYRRSGRKFLVLPWAKWWHCFDDPDQRRSDLTVYSKVRNYVLTRVEFGESLDDVYNHFVSTKKPDGSEYSKEELAKHLEEEHSVDLKQIGYFDNKITFDKLKEIHQQRKLPEEDWEWLIENPIERTSKKPDPMKDMLQRSLKNNDLSAHLNILREYASNSNKVLDISRRPTSAIALLAGRPKEVKTYSFEQKGADWSKLLEDHYQNVSHSNTYLEFKGILEQDFEKDFDFCFFKPSHEMDGVKEMLNKISESCNTIAIHDTKDKYKKELINIIKEMVDTDEWHIIYHSNEDFGLTIISKENPKEEVIAWVPEDGPGNDLKGILESYGLKTGPNCGCNRMAAKMNVWGPEGCLEEENLKEISSLLEANAKKWFNTSDATWWKKTSIGLNLLKSFVNPANPYEGLVKLAVNNYKKRIEREEK